MTHTGLPIKKILIETNFTTHVHELDSLVSNLSLNLSQYFSGTEWFGSRHTWVLITVLLLPSGMTLNKFLPFSEWVSLSIKLG